jgi:hypothetical protein
MRRFLAIWRRSGSFALAQEAARNHCQVPVLEFLRSGGMVTGSEVRYGPVQLPRPPFTGPGLAGVAYVKKFVDFGGRIDQEAGSFVAGLPSGVRFEATGGALVDTILKLHERYLDEEYAWIEAGVRVVIDVGANIGDSVVYFAGRGAAFVYGFEPEPSAYRSAVRNLDLNHVENASVAQVAVTAGGNEGASLMHILKRAATDHPGATIACKIDCEGCEYDLLAPGAVRPEVMRPVAQMLIEYHHRSPQPLRESLQSLGFEVETAAGAPGVGWIRAWRRR